MRQLNIRELPRLQKIQRSLFSFADFLKRMSKMYDGRITIFLDEADRFLHWARYVLSPALRASVNAGICRYIVAGFQALMDELYSIRSPFFLAFEPLRLGPFDRKEIGEIVLAPMKSLRVRVENEQEIVAQIQADTRGHPHLVQYYCAELVKQLERQGSRTLRPASLAGIYANDGFKSLIINAFRDNVSIQDNLHFAQIWR